MSASSPANLIETKNPKPNLTVRFEILVPVAGPRIAMQYALLGDPTLRVRYLPAQLFAKNSPPDCFINAKTLLGFKSRQSDINKNSQTKPKGLIWEFGAGGGT